MRFKVANFSRLPIFCNIDLTFDHLQHANQEVHKSKVPEVSDVSDVSEEYVSRLPKFQGCQHFSIFI
jgi:hypothetical protein